MCRFTLQERKKNSELRVLLGLEPVILVTKKVTLRWFGHMECTDDTDWIKYGTMMEVERTKPRGCLRKSWWHGIKGDKNRFGLSPEDAQTWRKWRRKINGVHLKKVKPSWIFGWKMHYKGTRKCNFKTKIPKFS